jgi:RND family efflux transporter MFP subunit
MKRDVVVGDVVAPGQTLAKLDPIALSLAVQSSEADLEKATSVLVNSAAAEQRQSILLSKDVVAQSTFDSAQLARAAAAASVEQAKSALKKAGEQLTYTNLSTEFAGVVTGTFADVGQTVAAGEKIVTVARTDIREAVVDVPDAIASSLSKGAKFDIVLQSDPALTTSAAVREIAPQADAATRTRRIKITLDRVEDGFRLGATIRAIPVTADEPVGFAIPASALLERDGATRIWVVDRTKKTVSTTLVALGERNGQTVRVVEGLENAALVVIAGVNSLTEGQAVKLDPPKPDPVAQR